MPRIPDYTAQIDNQAATSRRTTESGAFDTITNPGLPWQALGGLGRAIQNVGEDAGEVVSRIKKMTAIDLQLQQKKSQAVGSRIKKMNEADAKTAIDLRLQQKELQGMDILDKMEQAQGQQRVEIYNKEWIPFLDNVQSDIYTKSNITEDSSFYEQKYKQYDLTPRDKANIEIRRIGVFDRLDRRAGKLGLEARQTVAIQAIQTKTNNIILNVTKDDTDPSAFFDGLAGIEHSISSIDDGDLQYEKKKIVFDSQVQRYTASFLDSKLDAGDRDTVREVLNGNYNDYLVGISGDPAISNQGITMINKFRDKAKILENQYQIDDVISPHLGILISDPHNMDIYNRGLNDIKKSNLNGQQQQKALTLLDTMQKKYAEEGYRVESEKLNKLISEGKWVDAEVELETTKLISLKDREYFSNKIKDGTNPYNDYNPKVVADLQIKSTRIDQNTPQSQVNDLLTEISRARGFGLPTQMANELEGVVKSKKAEIKNPEIAEHYKVFSDWKNKYLFLDADQRAFMATQKSSVTKRSEYTKNEIINSSGYLDTKSMYDGYIASGKTPREAMDLVIQSFNKKAGRSWLSNLFRGMDETKWIQNPFNTSDWIQNPYSNESAIQPKTNETIGKKPKTWEEYKNARP